MPYIYDFKTFVTLLNKPSDQFDTRWETGKCEA